MNKTMSFLVGSAAVYAAMAACSGATTERLSGAGGSVATSDATSEAPNAVEAGVDALTDAVADMFDAATDPIQEAAAAEPTVITRPCDVEAEYSSGYIVMWAEAPFPGKTAAELSTVRASVKYATDRPLSIAPPGYRNLSQATWTKDGSVVAQCGFNGDVAESVTFILP